MGCTNSRACVNGGSPPVAQHFPCPSLPEQPSDDSASVATTSTAVISGLGGSCGGVGGRGSGGDVGEVVLSSSNQPTPPRAMADLATAIPSVVETGVARSEV
jgi:hypothetical protein